VVDVVQVQGEVSEPRGTNHLAPQVRFTCDDPEHQGILVAERRPEGHHGLTQVVHLGQTHDEQT